jgi:CRISPR-associated protein Csc3
MTFPINPAGENDTQKFLFVLQHALLLQRYLGCKALVSASVTPVLDKEAFGDVYFDLTPLSARGLIRENDYHEFTPGTRNPGSLHRLWVQLGHLFAIRRQVATPRGDDWAELVEAMADHPLRVFYVAEKLAEGKARADKASSAGWTTRAIVEDVRRLALSIGGSEMHQLDAQLQRLAEIAWRGGLRGQSLEKNSLLAPLNEVLAKVGVQSPELGPAVLQAAAAQDLYDHIDRIRKMSGRPYSRVRLSEASQEFVRVFFDEVFAKIYGSKPPRLLAHEKLIRSAFHFYIRQQIPRKVATADEATVEADAAYETDLNT